MKKIISYKEEAKQFACDFPIGTMVQVVDVAHGGEMGWGDVWVRNMDDLLFMPFRITGHHERSGVELCGTRYRFPFFVLEKV